MSQQGERPATEDDWWNRLYDESAPDTGPAAAGGDTLDDRFDSAADAVAAADPPDPPPSPEPPESERPRAWWETVAAARNSPDRPTAPPRQRTPWEPPAPERPPAFPPPPPPGPPRPDAAPVVQAQAGGAEDAEPPRPAGPPAYVPSPAQEPADQPPAPDQPSAPAGGPAPAVHPPARPYVAHVGDGPPTYDAEPTALPAAHPQELDELIADTVLDGASYGTYTLRAVSIRGDSARYRGEPRRDALLTARFGTGDAALVLVAVASGARTAGGAHLAAADACRWIGTAVGRSHARLADDIRGGRRGDLKSGLHRLTDRSFGRLRASAAEQGLEPQEYTANLRCLLLSADPECRTRVFFGVGGGGLFRLRGGIWQDIEPVVPESAAVTGAPVVGFGSPPAETAEGDRLTMDLGIATPPSPYIEAPPPPPAEPFRFRASVAHPGDTLLLCSSGLAEPLRGEPALAEELAGRWAHGEPPGLAAFLADTQLRVKGYADDRTAVAVWEA
ncbi:protein phosphatase 2C domain-containing protein [Streptomyces maoxianensis]|uniref:Protein phosphatase 2C domain-containing protein n=1 Tax=Streptomyces maoxianensis TaxID=1459942 RepID=A0ABV9G2P5_9ACTN